MPTKTEKEKKAQAVQEVVAQSSGGTGQWYKHSLVKWFLYTDGVRNVAQTAGAYWLVDEIAFAQRDLERKFPERIWDMQFWTLQNPSAFEEEHEHDAFLEMTWDDPKNPQYNKEIGYTDFPLELQKILVQRNEDKDGKQVLIACLPEEN